MLRIAPRTVAGMLAFAAVLTAAFWLGSAQPVAAAPGYCDSVCSYSHCHAICQLRFGGPIVTCRKFGSWVTCPGDTDGDGYNDYPNNLDNCPDVYNPDQRDCDRDGCGAACEVEEIGCGIDLGDWKDLPHLAQPANDASKLVLTAATGLEPSGGGASHFDFSAGGPAHLHFADIDPGDPIVEVVVDFVSTDFRKYNLGRDGSPAGGWSVTFDSGAVPDTHGQLYVTANRASGGASGLLYVVRSGS